MHLILSVEFSFDITKRLQCIQVKHDYNKASLCIVLKQTFTSFCAFFPLRSLFSEYSSLVSNTWVTISLPHRVQK